VISKGRGRDLFERGEAEVEMEEETKKRRCEYGIKFRYFLLSL